MQAEAKTRILFVDDEPLILEVLEMTVESMKDQWSMAFANSGQEALALMTKRPFDIIVSDMHMPGISGAQLLNEVMKRFPATVRIILSGYAEEDLVMKCVGATHQFLHKPFDLKALRALLERIRGLKRRVHSVEIQKLLTKKQRMPSIPAVYFSILEALQDPECPIERIGEIVSSDSGLTAKLLQLVNSAFFGFAREVSSAEEAVMLLGIGTIRSLALTMHLFAKLDTSQGDANSLTQVWSHSLHVARMAKRVAELEGGSDKIVEEAFTAGLLHDVGKMIMAENPANKYLELLNQVHREKRSLVEAEQQLHNATHAEVGAYLLDLWGLPAPLVEAVAYHHVPSQSSDATFSALTAVHVANALEPELEQEAGESQLLDLEYLKRLKLDERVEAWRLNLREL